MPRGPRDRRHRRWQTGSRRRNGNRRPQRMWGWRDGVRGEGRGNLDLRGRCRGAGRAVGAGRARFAAGTAGTTETALVPRPEAGPSQASGRVDHPVAGARDRGGRGNGSRRGRRGTPRAGAAGPRAEASGGRRSAKTPRRAIAAAIEVFLAGEEDELHTGWRLVDDRERPIRTLDLGED